MLWNGYHIVILVTINAYVTPVPILGFCGLKIMAATLCLVYYVSSVILLCSILFKGWHLQTAPKHLGLDLANRRHAGPVEGVRKEEVCQGTSPSLSWLTGASLVSWLLFLGG